MADFESSEYIWINSTSTNGVGPDEEFSLPSPDRSKFNPDVPRDIDFLNKNVSSYLKGLKSQVDTIEGNLSPDGDTDTKYSLSVNDVENNIQLTNLSSNETDDISIVGDGEVNVTYNDDNTIDVAVDLDNYYTKDEVDGLTPPLPENIAYTDTRNQFTEGQDILVDSGEVLHVKKSGDATLAIWADGKITQENILANTQDKEFVNRKNLTDAIEAIDTPDNIVNLDGSTRDAPPTDRIVMYVGNGNPSNWDVINGAKIGALFTSSSGEGLWIKESADADGWVRADDTEYTEHLKGGETNQILAKASEDEGHYVWKSFTLPDGQEPYPGISDEDGNEIQIRGDGLFVPEVVIPEIPELPDGIATEEYVDNAIDAIEIPVAAVYDSGWQTINGQKFRRVNYTVFGQGTISTPDVADLTDTEFVPTHPISVSAHYDADKTISNPVYSDGPLLKVNSQNGEDVVWSGSWSTNAEVPGLPDNGGSSATITNLVAEPAETSVTLTWDVE